VFQALGEHGVVCDWREPDVIRLGLVPLYNSFEDALRAACQLGACLELRR
jgi:kynureninase